MACESDKCEKYGLHHEYKDGIEVRRCFACESDERENIGLKCPICFEQAYEFDGVIYCDLCLLSPMPSKFCDTIGHYWFTFPLGDARECKRCGTYYDPKIHGDA